MAKFILAPLLHPKPYQLSLIHEDENFSWSWLLSYMRAQNYISFLKHSFLIVEGIFYPHICWYEFTFKWHFLRMAHMV